MAWTVHGIWATLAACPKDPPSVLGGSVLVRWSEQGTFVVVTTPGSGEANQRLVMALADHVRLVGPRRRPDADTWQFRVPALDTESNAP
jgi:hypothetical protein